MIDPISISMLTAGLLNKVIDGKKFKIYQELTNRAEAAKTAFENSGSSSTNPIEATRIKCLKKVCELQHDVVLCVTDSDFLKKVLPLLLAQIGNIYEAKSELELGIIDMSLERINNALFAYNNERKRQRRIRLYAVLVCLVALLLLGGFLYISKDLGIKEDSLIPMLALPVPVLIWSIIGSFTSILYRFTNAGDKELENPLRWLFSRPLSGIVMGAISLGCSEYCQSRSTMVDSIFGRL